MILLQNTYFKCELKSKQKDPKAAWKVLNESLNRSTSCDIKNIIFNDDSYSEPAEITNSFNTLFFGN